MYIWTNSKQDGELINTYDKKNTESREDTKIYVKIPCGKKTKGAGETIPLLDEANIRGESQQMWGGSKSLSNLSFSGGFGRSRLLLATP